MKNILFPRDLTGPIDSRILGGKAAALFALRDSGVPIPEWFVVTPQACGEGAGMGMGPAVTAEIKQALSWLAPNGAGLAVRSSGIEEDGSAHSFAGQFESYLSVPAEKVPEKVAMVWRSGASERLSAYRNGHGLAATPEAPAALIQRMVDADTAGIAFSADPVTGRRGVCIVNAVRGLGDTLAAGAAEGDMFEVDTDGEVRTRRLSDAEPSLSDTRIRRVAALARQMERHFGCPQDIEWAFAGDILYLLQSRAITNLPDNAGDAGDRPRLWDNSNIVESYSGVTTPLTFSFARSAYEGVYRQFALLMGVSPARIAANDEVFRNMLGLIRGRVYYNLLNWYRLLTLFPGFTVNRRFMEQMMGVGKTLPPDLARQVVPESRAGWRVRARDSFRLGWTLLGMIRNWLLLKRKIAAFFLRLDQALDQPSTPIEEQSLEGLARMYRDIERELLTRWDAPLINDFFCMIAFGLLGGLLRKSCGDEAPSLRNALIADQGDIVSAEPVRRIREMAALAADDTGLVRILTEGTRAEAEAAIARDAVIEGLYRAYLVRFEGRCFGELKLESATLCEDPLPLIRAIGICAAALRGGAKQAAADASSPEAALAKFLKGRPIRRWLIIQVVAEARNRIRDRENLRFERTRIFGLARRIFQRMGNRLHEAGVIANARDVFWLETEELLGFVEGTAVSRNLGEIAAVRKAEFEGFADMPEPPARFLTTGAVANAAICESAPGDTPDAGLEQDQYQGVGCCAGIVRGVVRVVRDPREATLREGEILVAEFTDPGWITLFSRAAGILVERGSLLSQSAIVAREMGIPAIVALPGIMGWLKDGDRVEMDGATGRLTRLNDEVAAPLAAE
jgi:pyruvate,water dikinase